MSELETRDFELRLASDAPAERSIRGIAVPYGQDANIGGQYVERFAPNAIDSVTDVKLFYDHKEPIGKVVEGRSTADGFEITAKLTEGVQRADEVLALMRDGVLNKFSVGFVPVESQRDGSTVIRTKVDLKEVSVVAMPAYSQANITEVRTESDEPITVLERTNMENPELDIRTVQDDVAELQRSVEALKIVPVAPSQAMSEYRSIGEYAKGLVSMEPAALELYERATTSSDAALRPAWVGYIDNLIDYGMPTLSAFARAALPATGLTIEWAKVNTNTIATGKQTTENTALTDGNISLSTVSTSVSTYGSQTSLSRQSIERSTVNYLDIAFRAMALGYAKQMNANVVATLAGLTWTGKTYDASAGTVLAITTAIADGTTSIYSNSGLLPEFIVCDPSAYKFFVTKVATDGRPVFNVDGAGVNNIGAGNLPRLAGSIFGLPIIVDPALAANTAYLANSEALTTYLSAGAPTRLTLESPSTLTNTYAVYGYAAVAVPFEAAVVKIKVV